MAEATAFRNNALPYPIYGAPWTVVFPMLDADGDLVTGATTPDAEVSKNGDTFADCTNESTEIATNSGVYYLTLTGAEMTADIVSVIAKSATAGMKTTVLTFYPRKLVALRSGTAQGGAAGYITLDASAGARDDRWNGCLCVATIDTLVEARIITDYTGSNQQAAVTPNWNVTPDSDDTFVIYLPEGMQLPTVNVGHIAETAQTGRDIGASVLLSAGTGTGQLDFTSGVVKANLVQILGSAITGTASQLVAAFTKFFNVATPTGTINSLPDAVAGATNGLFIAGTNAATTVTTALTTTFTGNLTGSVGSVAGLTAATVHSDLDDIQSRLPAALTANGNIKASLVEILTTALTETAGLLAGGFKKFFNVATPTGTVNSLPDAVAGATGGVFIAGTNAATTVTTALTTTFTGNLTGDVGGNVTGSVGSLATQAKADVNAEADTALTDINLDHLVKIAVDTNFATTVHLDSVIGQLADNGTTATFDRATDSLEALQGEIAAIEAQTDDIGIAGAGLTAIPWNAAWDTEVESEVDDALVVRRLDELLAADSDIDGAAPPAVGSVFHELMTKTAGSFTYDQATDSLEAIRDRGDTAWITATGFSTLDEAGIRTAVGLGSANLDTQLTAIDDYIDAEIGTIKAVTDKLDTALVLDGVVYQYTANALELAPTGGSAPTVAQIADEVQTRTIAGVTLVATTTNLTNLPAITSNWLTAAGIAASALNGKGDWNVGKTGYALSTAGVQAIWDALTSALTTVNSIGKLLVDNINATIGSRSSHSAADVWGVATRVLTAGTNIVLAKGTGVTGFNDLSAAQVNTEVDTALADVNLDHVAGTATGIPAIVAGTYLDQMMDDGTAAFDRTTDSLQAIRDRGDAAWDTADVSGLALQASVDDLETRLTAARAGYLDNLSAGAVATATSISALNNLSAAQVNAEVVDVLRTDTLPDSYAADGAQPTIAQAVLAIHQFLMEKAVSGTTVTVKKPDGSTTALTLTLNSDTSPSSITRAS